MNTVLDYRQMATLSDSALLSAKATISPKRIKGELIIWNRNLKECNEHIKALERILTIIEG